MTSTQGCVRARPGIFARYCSRFRTNIEPGTRNGGSSPFRPILTGPWKGILSSVGRCSPDRSRGCTCPSHGTALAGIRDRSRGNSFPAPRIFPRLSVARYSPWAITCLSWCRSFLKRRAGFPSDCLRVGAQGALPVCGSLGPPVCRRRIRTASHRSHRCRKSSEPPHLRPRTMARVCCSGTGRWGGAESRGLCVPPPAPFPGRPPFTMLVSSATGQRPVHHPISARTTPDPPGSCGAGVRFLNDLKGYPV